MVCCLLSFEGNSPIFILESGTVDLISATNDDAYHTVGTIKYKAFDDSPHRFRNSFAVHWLRCGGRLEVLSQMLGHSDIKTTMIYLKIVPVDQGKELLKVRF